MLLGPSPVVTITPTSPPAILAGVLQVIVILLTTIILVAAIPPNVIAVAPVKPRPVILTLVPPALVPDNGKIVVIKGTSATYSVYDTPDGGMRNTH